MRAAVADRSPRGRVVVHGRPQGVPAPDVPRHRPRRAGRARGPRGAYGRDKRRPRGDRGHARPSRGPRRSRPRDGARRQWRRGCGKTPQRHSGVGARSAGRRAAAICGQRGGH
eukprot:11225484-Lingulodinium_polyedra.AAC.1